MLVLALRVVPHADRAKRTKGTNHCSVIHEWPPRHALHSLPPQSRTGTSAAARCARYGVAGLRPPLLPHRGQTLATRLLQQHRLRAPPPIQQGDAWTRKATASWRPVTTQQPKIELARWAAAHRPGQERRSMASSPPVSTARCAQPLTSLGAGTSRNRCRTSRCACASSTAVPPDAVGSCRADIVLSRPTESGPHVHILARWCPGGCHAP